jgi:hypothetical protein
LGFGERLRAWLRGEDAGPVARSGGSRGSGDGASVPHGGPVRADRRSARRRGKDAHPAGAFDTSAMLEFARSRSGVEMYLEPRTNLYGDSVLLVADDGEYLRRPIPDAQTVRRFCAEHGIPVYDVTRTGYPRRVRDYDRGVRPRRIGLDDLPPWPGSDPTEPLEGADETPPPPPPTPPTPPTSG